MKRTALLFLLLGLTITLAACSGKSPTGDPQPIPNVSGAWEFIATSTTNPGYSTGIEVALKEGQSFVNGNYQENGQISASGPQINFVGFAPGGNIVLGGNCAPAAVNTGNSLTGSVSGVAGSMNFTYTENGNAFDVTATLDASGQSIVSGTYTSQSGSGCSDSGTITIGKLVSKISGTYTGKLILPDGTTDSVTATVSENSSAALTMNLISTSPDNTAFTLTGPVAGNYFSVSGNFNVAGQVETVTYEGYNETPLDPSSNVVPALYLVNVTNAAQPTYAGTLKVPPPQ